MYSSFAKNKEQRVIQPALHWQMLTRRATVMKSCVHVHDTSFYAHNIGPRAPVDEKKVIQRQAAGAESYNFVLSFGLEKIKFKDLNP